MYATVRQYRLNPIFEQDFVRVWQQVRQKLLDKNYAEYAVLHRESKISYLSYIHWQSKEIFENYIQKIPEPFQSDLQKIDECCNNNVILHRMTVLSNNPELV